MYWELSIPLDGFSMCLRVYVFCPSCITVEWCGLFLGGGWSGD